MLCCCEDDEKFWRVFLFFGVSMIVLVFVGIFAIPSGLLAGNIPKFNTKLKFKDFLAMFQRWLILNDVSHQRSGQWL
jgi:uncharacterized BrkB/YihY/UPF0761 family membrane protein